MNTFNRVVIIIGTIILVVACAFLFLIPHRFLISVGNWMVNLGEQLLQVVPWVRLAVGIVLTLLIVLAGLFFIYLEVRKRRPKYIRVKELSGGMATLSIDSIIQQLEYRIDPLRNVIRVDPRVKAKGQQVAATVDVTVTPGTNVPKMAAQLVDIVRQVLTDDLGLEVAGDPEVRITVAPPPEGRRGGARPPVPQQQSQSPRPRSARPAASPRVPRETPDWAGPNSEKEEGSDS